MEAGTIKLPIEITMMSYLYKTEHPLPYSTVGIPLSRLEHRKIATQSRVGERTKGEG